MVTININTKVPSYDNFSNQWTTYVTIARPNYEQRHIVTMKIHKQPEVSYYS